MEKILTVYENDRTLDTRLNRHCKPLQKITPPEALRQVEWGAISDIYYDSHRASVSRNLSNPFQTHQPRYPEISKTISQNRETRGHPTAASFNLKSCASGVSLGTEQPEESIHLGPASARATRICSRIFSGVSSLK